MPLSTLLSPSSRAANRVSAGTDACDTGGAVGTWLPIVVCMCLLSGVPLKAQGLDQALTPAEIDSASSYLRSAMAGPNERAYLQVLTQAVVEPDSTDTSVVYDLIVRYDPERFHDPHLGLYPLTFEDQFIQWGKRIALLTRSTRWPSGRFYLQNTANGQQAWIFSSETRLLYPDASVKLPGPVAVDNSAGKRQWLRIMHRSLAATDLQAMTRWLRLMRREPRDVVLLRSAAEVAARDSLTSP